MTTPKRLPAPTMRSKASKASAFCVSTRSATPLRRAASRASASAASLRSSSVTWEAPATAAEMPKPPVWQKASRTVAPFANRATRARCSRWSKNQPVFCPPSGSTAKESPLSSTEIMPASPCSSLVSSRRPSRVRTALSLRAITMLGAISACSASRISGVAASMPAVLAWMVTASP